jgi:hypothetical protein
VSDIDSLSRRAYELGADPLDWAAGLASNEFDAVWTILLARETDPSAFPGYFLDLTVEAAGRRVIGALLNAGWTPPAVP